MPRTHRLTALLALSAGLAAVAAPSALAIEFPGQGQIRVQTNGSGAPISNGDWYGSPLRTGGAGDHYVEIQVPSGWPVGRPIDVDLFSAELNRSGTPIALSLDEAQTNGATNTEFELYGPNIVATSPRSPARGAAGSITRRNYSPRTGAEQWTRLATIDRPVPDSTYLLRADSGGDDENSWKFRVGDDNDATPGNSPPANYDNPDGVTGSGDELGIRPVFVAYQHFGADGACHTFSRFVDAGAAEVRFNNFDMDLGNTGVVPVSRESQVRLRYYAPGDTFDSTGRLAGSTPSNHPAPFLSANDSWNGGARNTKVGDAFTNPRAGWWRIVYCTNEHNQYVVEADGTDGVPSAPLVRATMSDGETAASRGATLTYRINVSNEASGTNAGAAENVKIVDLLPPGLTFASCRVVDPFRGSCAPNGSGNPVATVSGLLRAGRTAQVEVKARIAATAPEGVAIENVGVITFTDTFDNHYPEVRVTDSTTVNSTVPDPAPDPDPDPVGPAF
jgi:uncharacterized repeat protein (TIGR01451 family)